MVRLRVACLAHAVFCTVLMFVPRAAEAEDFYCYRRLRELKTFEEVLPDGSKPPPANEAAGRGSSGFRGALTPYGMIPGGGELYLDADPAPDDGGGTGPILGTLREHAIVAIRLPEAPKGDVATGWLYVPKENGPGMKPVKFFLNTKLPSPDAKQVFATTKRKHYEYLAGSGHPGAAWFQHQVRAARALAGNEPGKIEPDPNRPAATNDAERLYALFSGGRAINENLQLDRPLTAANPVPRPSEPPPVRLDTLGGITVAEIDWKPLIAGKTPVIDPLAKLVPHDQHALFLPNLKAAETLIAEAASNSSPIWRSLGVENQMRSVLARYERQLGIGLAELSKFPGSQTVKGVVLTGSDPYFVSGTDLALLLETDSPGDLVKSIAEHFEKVHRDSGSGLQFNKAEESGVTTFSLRSEDRRVSAYLSATSNAVILSNSAFQLGAVLATSRGERGALAVSPEYVYFRLKYPRGEERESAFLVLSDSTIRRWCGPRWRIGSSRRLRAAAGLAALQADHLAEIAAGKTTNEPLPAATTTILGVDLGEVQLTNQGIHSRTFGTLESQTPISELPLETVSKSEADSYATWRDGYQNNWRGTFDPIAVRFKITDGKPRRIGVDLTVTPLIANSDYRDAIKLVGGASFAATAGDPHPEALVHAIMALDAKSNLIQTGGDQIIGMTNLPKDAVLGWIGEWISLYVDDGKIWKDLLKNERQFRTLQDHLSEVPVGLQVAVTDGLKLALFLSGVRAFAEQSAPGLVKWENLDYKGRKYVRISEQAGARPELEPGKERFALYYAPTPGALVVSPNEALIKRFLDRRESSPKPGENVAADGKTQNPKPAAVPEWLGRNLGLRLTADGIKLLRMNGSESYRDLMRSQSWANLPILNEWRRLFPDRDPVRFHEALWGEKLICPGGGEYVWDEQWQTMKSTAFNHPGDPRPGPEVQAPLADVDQADFGISFEDGGLRGRVEIELSEPGK